MSKAKTQPDAETMARMEALVKGLQTEGKQYVKEAKENWRKRQDEEAKLEAARRKAQQDAQAENIAAVIDKGSATHVFVDDKIASPSSVTTVQLPHGKTWRVITNYEDFIKYVEKEGIPEVLSLDFDLGQGKKTGLDCLEWFMKHCIEQKRPKLPTVYCHSGLTSHQQLMEAKTFDYSKLRKKAGL